MMGISKIFSTFIKNIQKSFTLPEAADASFSYPLCIITILACVILFVVVLRARKIKFTPQMVARLGLVLAITFILHAFKIFELPNALGSITLGSFIPLMIISFMYGPEIGMFTGFVYGILNLLMGGYMLNPVQVLFDYPLPFMCLGIAGFFKDKKFIGALVAVFFKFVCHFISGVAFFGSYAPKGMSPWLYSLVANGAAQGVECVICLVILAILPIERLMREVNRSSSIAKA